MLNVTNNFANQNYNKISPHANQNGHHQKNLETINAEVGVKKREPLQYCWWECKLIQPLQITVQKFLKKLKVELSYDPATPLLDIYPKKMIIQKDTCTPIFIAALFIIAETWKQPKCPSIDKQIKSDIKMPIFYFTQRNLNSVSQGLVSQGIHSLQTFTGGF